MTRSIEQKDFRDRVSQFSTHGKKNGRVDVIPVEGQIDDHCYTSILEQREILKSQLHRATDKNRIHSIKGQIGNIDRLISLAKEERKGWVFMQVANKKLKHGIFKAIDLEAEALIAYKAVQDSDDWK